MGCGLRFRAEFERMKIKKKALVAASTNSKIMILRRSGVWMWNLFRPLLMENSRQSAGGDQLLNSGALAPSKEEVARKKVGGGGWKPPSTVKKTKIKKK